MAETTFEPQQTTLLRILERPADGRLSAGDLKKKLGLGSKKGSADSLDASEADQALTELIAKGLIAVVGGAQDGLHPRPNASYRLTKEGKHQLRPARPDIPEEQLQAQEAFILLQVFRAKEQKLTRSELNGKLKSRAAVGQLEFDVKASPATVDYHLAELVDKGSLIEQKRGVSVSYSLHAEHGAKALASVKQHEAVSFTMTGETLNALLAAARQSKAAEPKVEDSSQVDGFIASVSQQAAHPLDPYHIMKYVDQLRSDKYAGNDKIPIHEVRRLIADHHGEEASSHSTFDPLIKQMRSNGQLRLIAISNSGDATQAQLDDSIPGMNETLFYIVSR